MMQVEFLGPRADAPRPAAHTTQASGGASFLSHVEAASGETGTAPRRGAATPEAVGTEGKTGDSASGEEVLTADLAAVDPGPVPPGTTEIDVDVHDPDGVAEGVRDAPGPDAAESFEDRVAEAIATVVSDAAPATREPQGGAGIAGRDGAATAASAFALGKGAAWRPEGHVPPPVAPSPILPADAAPAHAADRTAQTARPSAAAWAAVTGQMLAAHPAPPLAGAAAVLPVAVDGPGGPTGSEAAVAPAPLLASPGTPAPLLAFTGTPVPAAAPGPSSVPVPTVVPGPSNMPVPGPPAVAESLPFVAPRVDEGPATPSSRLGPEAPGQGAVTSAGTAPAASALAFAAAQAVLPAGSSAPAAMSPAKMPGQTDDRGIERLAGGEFGGPSTAPAAQAARWTPMPLAASEPARVVHQIADAISRSSDGSIELALSPKELGSVRMSIHATETGTAIVMNVERDETMQLIRRHAELLHEAFRDMGLGRLDLSFGGRGQDRPGTGTGGTGPAPAGASGEIADAPVRPSPRTAAGGLDLRM